MAGSLIGSIENGVYKKTDASAEATKTAENTASTSKTAASNGTEYNEEMFLQLLIAEMQYQDPLEPSDNSQYVSQLASFTQIEAIQSVQSDMQTIQANSLVGKYVIMKNEDGTFAEGKVDYVYNDEGELFLSIGGELYSADTLDSVVDEKYFVAVNAAAAFKDSVDELASISELNLADEKAITEARTLYDAMDSYTKTYVNAESLSKLEALENRLAALKAASESSDTAEETSESTEEADETTGT